jgi:hypothetical protein
MAFAVPARSVRVALLCRRDRSRQPLASSLLPYAKMSSDHARVAPVCLDIAMARQPDLDTLFIAHSLENLGFIRHHEIAISMNRDLD